MWGDKNYRIAGRAADADVVLLSASRFDEYPDLQVTDSTFRTLSKVTDGGAQMRPFLWGTSELVSFRNTDGVPLKAALYKPADFDPKKKYPLLVYIYEGLSQNVHNFVEPRPSHNINFSLYVSNGYLVLTPDIVYTEGQPGPERAEVRDAGDRALVGRGIVDEAHIGIQGHSWGGYQIAYMVTQTNRFRAVEAGAPVGNMTSAYSGIRWGTGLPRQFQYEQTQSRIGQSAVRRAVQVSRELADLPHRPRQDADADAAQRQRRCGAVVSGHRAVPRAAPQSARKPTCSATTASSMACAGGRTRRTSRCACSSSSTTS